MTSLLAPDDILRESFRIIDSEVGAHSFGSLEWPIVRRMIHACGDIEIAKAACFTHDAAAAGVAALRRATPIVTDVRMVAAGIKRDLVDVCLHCFIDDPDVQREARATGRTRSHWAMVK